MLLTTFVCLLKIVFLYELTQKHTIDEKYNQNHDDKWLSRLQIKLFNSTLSVSLSYGMIINKI